MSDARNEEWYRHIFDNTNDPMFVLPVDENGMPGKFIDVNDAACRILGYSKEEFKNLSVLDVNKRDSNTAKNLPAIMKKLMENRSNVIESVHLAKDGREIPVEVSARIFNVKGVKTVLSVARDISERKRLDRELQRMLDATHRATRLKDQFVMLVSHDLRTPLGNMIGLLRQMAGPNPVIKDPEKRDKVIERVVKSGMGLVALIDGLLDISRLQSGSMVIKKSVVDAWGVVDDSLNDIHFSAAEKGITIVNDVPAGRRIFADRVIFAEVIKNIVSNAVKFCGKGNTVTVSYAVERRDAIITVRDDGPGVNAKFLPDLFKKEVKTTSAGTAGEAGTGLGLPYSHEIVKQHGGSLTVESEPGAGATFHIRLPAPRIIILVVDDQPAQRKTIKDEILGFIDAEVLEAENGKEAMIILDGVVPSLVITDIQMPEMDGFQLLRNIRMHHWLSAVPVVVASSSETWDTLREAVDFRNRAFELGASDFVLKPLDRADFIPRVSRFLRAYFDWDNQLIVGIPYFDRQHQELFQTIMGLQKSLETGHSRGEEENLFGELVRQSKEHFSDEEKYMRECGHPERMFEAHLREHERLLREVNELKDDFEAKGKLITPELVGRLLDWVKIHIGDFDKKIPGKGGPLTGFGPRGWG